MAFDPSTAVTEAPVQTGFDPSSAAPGPDWDTLFSGVDGLNYRLPYEQRIAVDNLERGTQGEPDQRAAAINLAYVTAALPNMDPTVIHENWPAIREAFAKHALGIDKPGISDGEVYGAISAHEKAKQIHTREEFLKADTFGKIKLLGSLFAAHSRENVAEVWDQGKVGLDNLWTPFKPLPEAPEMPDNPTAGFANPAVVAGVYNSVAKPFLEGVETPGGILTMGVGGTLKSVGTVAARRALAGMQFVFSGLMAKAAVDSTVAAVNAPAEPGMTTQQQIEKWGKPVGEAGMALLAGLGGVMDMKTPAEQEALASSLRGKTPQEAANVLRNEVETTTNPDIVPPLLDAANKLEAIGEPAIKAAETAAQAPEEGAAVGTEMKGAKGVISELTSLPEFKGFKEVLNKWVGDTQLGTMETTADIKEVKQAVPDELTRRAIGRWLDAGGDPATLERYQEGSKGPGAKKEYAVARNLNPEQLQVAEGIRAWFQERFEKAVSAGVMSEQSFRQDYLTQLIERPFVQGGDASKFGQQLNKNFQFSKERAFPNLFELERAGFNAKTTDIAEIMARYDSALNKAIQSRELVKGLLETKNAEGQPLAIPLKGQIREGTGTEPRFINNPRQRIVDENESAIQKLQKKAEALVDDIGAAGKEGRDADVKELRDIRREIEQLRAEQNPDDQMLYKAIDHPALRKWWWIGKDTGSGKEVFMEGDIGLHPDIRSHLENALGTSGLRRWYDSEGNAVSAIPKGVVKSIDKSNGFLKRNLLGGFSIFHAVHEVKRAAGNRVAVKPWDLKEIDPENPRIKLQVRSGLMLTTPSELMSQFSEGLGQSGSLVDRIPVIGKFSKAIGEFTFHKLIPSIKSQVWDSVYERNLETFKDALSSGEATKEQVAYLTSHQINARFGHLNLADLGRNPTVQHWAQILTLAPDFWESNVRNYGQTIQGLTGAKVGREPIVAFAATGLVVWLTARVMNQALDDDWHFEKPFGVIHDGRKYSMRNEVEDLWRMFHDQRQYIMGRLSPTLNAMEEWRSGRNWRGEKIDTLDVFKNWVSKVIPMSVRWIPGIKQLADSLESGGGRTVGTVEQFLGSLGIQVSRHSEISDAYKLANDYKHAQGVKEDVGTYPVSPYQKLRYALEDGDLKAAKAEMEKLTEGGEKDISRGFKQSLFHPFTGKDKEFEQGFRDSQDANGQKAIESAEENRRRIWDRYIRVVGETTASNSDQSQKPSRSGRKIRIRKSK